MKQRWSVQNHIKTVHAIAVCNLVEMCMGLVVEATILNHLRWLPMGMNIDYKKKAIGKLTALSIVDAKQFFILPKYPGVVEVPVDVKNEENTIVTTAQVLSMHWHLFLSKLKSKFRFVFGSQKSPNNDQVVCCP